ncbi:geranylgeranyl transferase type-2 subunit alpha [Agrilus planipennis]|uniref:Geranylgeranyl transferase type-2 subunit alpha n=1 Tax=Agrilus planipennis TaxID=224129 RepID=A0A7F5RIR8_AGRPL|nr:geranylgeranyl transferase type-2 subunit alpha [Agrilus planipennis]
MHGRLKVRTTEEQRLLKEKEQQKKLTAYQTGMKQILSTRNPTSYDPKSFAISAQLLVVNPDIYTLWNYRKEVILLELDKSKSECKDTIIDNGICDEKSQESLDVTKGLIKFLENEIRLTEQCLLANPKSYGSWHHRYWIMEHHPEPNWQNEFELCTKYLTMDDRNFHCWDYRRLILNKIGMSLEDEIKFSTERINVNFSNYSSWHYRSTLRKLDKDSLESEINLIMNAIFTDPADSSAWFYLRWVLSNPEMTEGHRKQLSQTLDQLLELEPDSKWCLLAKCWINGIKKGENMNEDQIEELTENYKKLLILDPLRKGFYSHYLNALESKKLNNA